MNDSGNNNNLLPVPLKYTYPIIIRILFSGNKYESYFVPELNRWITSNSLNRVLKINNIDSQEWYDRWILRSAPRPKCAHRYCDKETTFKSISHGYDKYCSLSCSNKETHYGNIFSEERRRKIGEANKRRIWSEESKEKLRQGCLKNPIIERKNARENLSKALKGKKQSPEAVANRVASFKANGSNKGKWSQERKDAVRKTRIKNGTLYLKVSDETKKKIKLSKIESWKHPSKAMINALKKTSRGTISTINFRGTNILVDSNLERNYIISLENTPTLVDLIREPLSIPYVKPTDGLIHNYFPDFMEIYYDPITGGKTVNIVEIKPYSQLEDSIVIAKRDAAVKYCNNLGYNYIIITDKLIYKNDLSRNGILKFYERLLLHLSTRDIR